MAESMTNPFCRLFRPFCVNYEVIFCNIKKPPAHRQAAFLILNCFFISSRLKSKLSVLHLLWQLLLYSMLTGSPYMYSGAGCSVQLHSAYNPSQIQQIFRSILCCICFVISSEFCFFTVIYRCECTALIYVACNKCKEMSKLMINCLICFLDRDAS